MLFAALVIRNWQTQHSKAQASFLKGTSPNPTPNGFLHGSVGIKTSWLGKKFDAKSKTGINVLRQEQGRKELFPFKTYRGKGLIDTNLEVLKIDYNTSQNPWYIHFILDELVQQKPGIYLGKLHLRLLPGVSFALGFFTLTK